MRSLRELLPLEKHSSKGVQTQRAVDEKTVFFLFDQIVEQEYGKRGRAGIFPAQYEDTRLTVKTKSPLWANELFIQQATLIDRLNASIGQEIVTELKIIHGATSGSSE